MEQEVEQKLSALEEKLNQVHDSVEKTRKYILVMTVVSVGAVALPLIGLVIVVPIVLRTFSSAYAGLL